MKKFWSFESGQYKIQPDSLLKFLESKGFYTYKASEDAEPVLIRIKDNRIKQYDAKAIRRYCNDYIRDTYEFQSPEEKAHVTNVFVNTKILFSKDNLQLLKEAVINEVKDTKEKTYLFFKNCYLEITADGVIKKSYDQLEGHVWEKDVIDFDFEPDIPVEIEPKGEYFEFFQDITKHENDVVQRTNMDSLVTITGYLLSRHKDEAEAKAIILMDTYKDGNANGGTGKGIYRKGLEQIRHVAMQDGKFYKSSDKFALSNLSYGTRVLVFDDVPKDFNFERLFPLITEKAVVERKYENKYEIPFAESPKVMITTNYSVEGKGSSHRRRKVEFILSDTYSDEYTPEDRFGHLLFSSWKKTEWEQFYLFMAYCIQMYLLEGIVKPSFNVAERTLKLNASPEFIQYANSNIEPEIKLNKKEVFEDFKDKVPGNESMEQYTFTRWIRLYADAYGFKMIESHSGSENYFELKTVNN